MGRQIDYPKAQRLLEQIFEESEANFAGSAKSPAPASVEQSLDVLFASHTQAYRETLVGCALARIVDPQIDIRFPYMNQAATAFNGRTLDERVVNPFLHERQIPCSRGPYLSTFRRNVRFEENTARGLRDRLGFSHMLAFIERLRGADPEHAINLLRRLLERFVEMRNAAEIPLTRIARLSIEQYRNLFDRLLAISSGGRMPVLVVLALLRTLNECYGRDWEIDAQDINVADAAHGVGGDITVHRHGQVVLEIEVTERTIDRARVVATFTRKIGPHGLDDYVFFFSGGPPSDEARAAARHYFAAGHEINFVGVLDWLIATIATIGPQCRTIFTREFLSLLSDRSIPAVLKVAWNSQVASIL